MGAQRITENTDTAAASASNTDAARYSTTGNRLNKLTLRYDGKVYLLYQFLISARVGKSWHIKPADNLLRIPVLSGVYND